MALPRRVLLYKYERCAASPQSVKLIAPYGFIVE